MKDLPMIIPCLVVLGIILVIFLLFYLTLRSMIIARLQKEKDKNLR